jgi:hypothetical protein
MLLLLLRKQQPETSLPTIEEIEEEQKNHSLRGASDKRCNR